MLLIYAQILGLSLLIILSVTGLIKLFAGKKILEIEAVHGIHEFTVTQDGFYSLWIFGKAYRRIPLDEYHSQILDKNNRRKTAIPSLFRASSNNGDTGTMQLKYFYLTKGDHKFVVTKETEGSLSLMDKALLPLKIANTNKKFGYRLKKTYPEFLLPFLIAGLLLSIFSIVALSKQL